jgi:hypothetical protein
MNKLIRQLRDLNKLTHFTIITLTLIYSLSSFGFLGLHETAELIPTGQNRIGIIPQLYVANGGGLDTAFFLDIFAGQDLNSRFEVGSGVNDFWAAGSIKWIPYPDYEKQPAMGLRGKFIFVREQNRSFYNTQLAPMLSKKVQTTQGLLIAYTGLPVTFIYEKNTNNFMVSQFCFGSEWVISKDFQMGAEFEMSLNNATNTLSAYLNFQFDEKIGFKK